MNIRILTVNETKSSFKIISDSEIYYIYKTTIKNHLNISEVNEVIEFLRGKTIIVRETDISISTTNYGKSYK